MPPYPTPAASEAEARTPTTPTATSPTTASRGSKFSLGGSTLAEYSYLADGARLSAVGSDGTGVRYLGSLIYSRASDGTLSLDCALTPGGRIVRTAGAGTSGTYQVQHFLRDHLGSVRTIVDGATGGVLETSDYLPLGKRWDLTGGQASQTVTDPTNRWRFSGKESQAFFDQGIPYSDFGARLHDPRTGRWLAPDPLAEKYHGTSMYCYCHSSPINMIDIGGNWDIKISANENRAVHNYAILSAYTNNGELFYSTVVKVKGKYTDRTIKYGDTPTGNYKILEWRETGKSTRYPIESFGENYLLALDYISGEAEGKRQGMHLHAGRKRDSHLVNTLGCIRISEDDIMELYNLTQWLEESDNTESKGYLSVENDLENPVDYSDVERIKGSVSFNGGQLDSAVVTAYKNHSY